MLKHYLSFFAGTIVVITGSYALAQTAPLVLTSPNQQLVMHFGVQPAKDATSEDGRLVYSLIFRGKPVLDDSGLALELDNQTPLGANIHIVTSDAGQGVDDYTLSNAKISKVRDAYNSLAVHVQEGQRAASQHDGGSPCLQRRDRISLSAPRGGLDQGPASAPGRHGVSSEHGRHELGAGIAELSQQLRE